MGGLAWASIENSRGLGAWACRSELLQESQAAHGEFGFPNSGSARVRRGLIRTDFWVIIGLPNAHIVNPFGYYFVKGRKFSQGRKKCANYEEYNDLSDFSPSEGKAFGVNSRHCSTMWKSGSYSHHSAM